MKKILKYIKFVSYTRKLLWNWIILNNHARNSVRNHLKISYVKFRIHAEKDLLCFYKNSANQTSIFISSKVVYFRTISHIKYSTLGKRHLHCFVWLKMFRMTARQSSFQRRNGRATSYLFKRDLSKSVIWCIWKDS